MTDKKGTILLLGSFGQTNLGDDILLLNFIDFLVGLGVKKIIINANDQRNIPSSIQPRVEIIKTYDTSPLVWLGTIFKVDAVVYGGGSVYRELPKSTGRGRYSVMIRIAIFNIVAKIFGRPVLNLNIGIGALDSSISVFITKICLKFSSYSVFRDKNSYFLAKNVFKIHDNKICLGVDGFFLNPEWNKPKAKAGDYKKRKTIGLNILSDVGDSVDRTVYIYAIRRFVNYLLEKEYTINFIPFQTSFNKNNDLDFFTKEFSTYIKSKRIHLEENVSSENILEIFSKIDIFIGMRFHSLLISTATTTPFLSIDYDIKCTNYLKEYNYPHSVKLGDISFERLLDEFAKLEDNLAGEEIKLRQMSQSLFAKKECMREAEKIIQEIIK